MGMIVPKFSLNRYRRRNILRSFNGSLNFLVAKGVYTVQEAIRERGHLATLLKRRPKRRSHA